MSEPSVASATARALRRCRRRRPSARHGLGLAAACLSVRTGRFKVPPAGRGGRGAVRVYGARGIKAGLRLPAMRPSGTVAGSASVPGRVVVHQLVAVVTVAGAKTPPRGSWSAAIRKTGIWAQISAFASLFSTWMKATRAGSPCDQNNVPVSGPVPYLLGETGHPRPARERSCRHQTASRRSPGAR